MVLYRGFLTTVFMLVSLLVDPDLVLGLYVLGVVLPLLRDFAGPGSLELLVDLVPSFTEEFVSDCSLSSSTVVSMTSLDDAEAGFPESESPLDDAEAGFPVSESPLALVRGQILESWLRGPYWKASRTSSGRGSSAHC